MLWSSKNIVKKASLNRLDDITTKIQAETKILDLFKSEGKGGVIKISNEPIFPLKTTIEFLMQSFVGAKIAIKKASEIVDKLYSNSPSKYKQEKENKCRELSIGLTKVYIEGYTVKNDKNGDKFKHVFEIQNNKITSLEICL